jgi:hypothetical protein
MSGGSLSEQQLADLERRRDPETVAMLVRIIREQQHAIDRLRLSTDVALRDREELRAALLQAREELQRLRQEKES